MFTIPDDDETFWEDLPSETISSNIEKADKRGSCAEKGDVVKRLRTFGKRTDLESESRCLDQVTACSSSKRKFCFRLPDTQRPCDDVASQTKTETFVPRTSASLADDMKQLLHDNGRNTVHKQDAVSTKVLESQQGGHSLVLDTDESFLLNSHIERTCKRGGKSKTNNTEYSKVNHLVHAKKNGLHFDVPKQTKRKFPGPAGLLPKLDPGQSLMGGSLVDVEVAGGTGALDKSEAALSSHNSADAVFEESPWQMLLKDLGKDAQEILDKFCIKNILAKARRKQLSQGKVSLLFSVLDSLDTRCGDAGVILRDKTGTMRGTIHRDLVKEYEDEFRPGTVLVLRQVGVISPTPRTHYLNITPRNLVLLYSCQVGGTVEVRQVQRNSSPSDLVKMAELQHKLTGTSSSQGKSVQGIKSSNLLSKSLSIDSIRSLPRLQQNGSRLSDHLPLPRLSFETSVSKWNFKSQQSLDDPHMSSDRLLPSNNDRGLLLLHKPKLPNTDRGLTMVGFGTAGASNTLPVEQSQLSPSGSNSVMVALCDSNTSCVKNTFSMTPPCGQYRENSNAGKETNEDNDSLSLWQDDLSDDVLSQLSEEFMV